MTKTTLYNHPHHWFNKPKSYIGYISTETPEKRGAWNKAVKRSVQAQKERRMAMIDGALAGEAQAISDLRRDTIRRSIGKRKLRKPTKVQFSFLKEESKI